MVGGFWFHDLVASAVREPAPPTWGPLGAPDESGLKLPTGFRSRVIARSGDPIGGHGHVWHDAPDGGACFPGEGGGWIYVSNAEVGGGRGGASAVAFDPGGRVIDAYPILTGTTRNCAGGPTPWNTWLSCEENGADGQVWECDPTRPGQGIVRPALGSFNHEAAAVDPDTDDVFLTEDKRDGRLYRFRPAESGDLSSGALWAATLSTDPATMSIGDSAPLSWSPVASDAPDRSATTAAFDGGEGAWIANGALLFVTKGDTRVWRLDLASSTLLLVHDCIARPDTPLDAVDNIVVHEPSGQLFVAEDGGNMQLCVVRGLTPPAVEIDVFTEIVGHDQSEVTGPAFAPDGRRLYFSSQRGSDGRGVTFEVTGPFPDTMADIGLADPDGLSSARRLGPIAD